MNPPPFFDIAALETDLRMMTTYAARVGVLSDPQVLESLSTLEKGRRSAHAPEVHALTLALNKVAQAILPMTLADLRSGRDPLEPDNQRRARVLQLGLAALALVTMLIIGSSMQSLRIEKTGLKALEQFQTQAMQPTRKATELRKIAQFDDPLAKPNLSSDLYREKLAEWVALYQTRVLLDTRVDAARMTADWPWSDLSDEWLVDAIARVRRMVGMSVATAKAGQPPSGDSVSPSAGPLTAMAQAAPDQAAAAPLQGSASVDFCVRDANGAFRLPAASARHPDWVRNLNADSINDFCFQYEVLQPITGMGSMNLTSQNLGRVGLLPDIEKRVAMRSDWYLPFFFGVLGSIIFVMRNIASIRTPTMRLLPMLMRISLGGVAGIVIGWFSTAALPTVESTSALSVPFALAFLSGYAIDALFSVLDRASRVMPPGAPTRAAAA